MPSRLNSLIALALLTAAPRLAAAQSLRGSPASVDRQYEAAIAQQIPFLKTSSEINRVVQAGGLVPVRGGLNYELAAVSYPFARPEVRAFVERLSSQYKTACGEPLVVTSLTRPENKQPRNASDESVHPAGMAVDLRVSNKSKCRKWLETTLLTLERTNEIEATRERRPAHFHVAVFPTQTAVAAAPAVSEEAVAESTSTADYRVNRGDSLWSIARRFNTSVPLLMELNELRSASLQAGDTISVPVANQPPVR